MMRKKEKNLLHEALSMYADLSCVLQQLYAALSYWSNKKVKRTSSRQENGAAARSKAEESSSKAVELE
jgi:hypothetical protein